MVFLRMRRMGMTGMMGKEQPSTKLPVRNAKDQGWERNSRRPNSPLGMRRIKDGKGTAFDQTPRYECEGSRMGKEQPSTKLPAI